MHLDAKVTILMPTYNKEMYIKCAIDSVLMQKVDFPFHLLIIDDKSTDQSLQIAQDYKNKYPDYITIIANLSNRGCLYTTIKGYEHTKTEYFCVLDPDDYWIDENKLQNAVQFLDKNRDFTMYIANTSVDNGKEKTPYYNINKPIDFDFDSQESGVMGHTSGVIFRNVIFKNAVPSSIYKQISTNNEKLFEGDSFRNLLHLKEGKAHAVNKIESVYRITGDGIWTSYSKFQQNIFNSYFYLRMFEYFNERNPTFFIKYCWFYCKASLDLLLQSYSSIYAIKEIELENFYALFKEILNYKEKYLPNNNDIHKRFLFFLPSRIIGGYEFAFIRLAKYFSEKIGLEVYYIDYIDGFARQQLANTKVKFIEFTENDMVIDSEHAFNLISPFTMSSEIPKFKNKKTKNTFWFGHPNSIIWLSCRSGLTKNRLNQYLRKLIQAKAVCFMDWACWDSSNAYSSVKFDENYVPMFTEDKALCPTTPLGIIDNDAVNIAWLGRLDSDKIFSLINLIDRLYELPTTKKKNLHIIGDGNKKDLINQTKYSDKINIIFTYTLINEKRDEYLLKNVDILFAMGISCLEGASLKIPSVLVFLSEENMDSNDFLWLFNSQKFTLGYSLDQKRKANLETTNFIEIIKEVYVNHGKERFGLHCYKYFKNNHNIVLTVSNLLAFIVENTLTSSFKVNPRLIITKKISALNQTYFGKLIKRLFGRKILNVIKRILLD
jgi:glycosyltransferase involved in cell wall biosynthesis